MFCLNYVKKRKGRRRTVLTMTQRAAVGKCENCRGSAAEWLEHV